MFGITIEIRIENGSPGDFSHLAPREYKSVASPWLCFFLGGGGGVQGGGVGYFACIVVEMRMSVRRLRPDALFDSFLGLSDIKLGA